MITETSLLRVAFPGNATTQQPPLNRATGGATGAQQPPAKPASLLDIARNKLRNMHATSAENTAQQATQKADEVVAQHEARNNLNSAKQENLANMRDSSLLRVAFPSNATAQQVQDTLETDYADLTACIIELCQLAGYSGEVRERMLTARQNLYPRLYATELAYFRLQVMRAKAGAYWGSVEPSRSSGDATPSPNSSEGRMAHPAGRKNI